MRWIADRWAHCCAGIADRLAALAHRRPVSTTSLAGIMLAFFAYEVAVDVARWLLS